MIRLSDREKSLMLMIYLLVSTQYTNVTDRQTPHNGIAVVNIPSARQRGWLRHCSQREAAVRQRLGGKRIGRSMPKDWLKMSRSRSELSVQTMLLAAGCSGSGNVPCTYRPLFQLL